MPIERLSLVLAAIVLLVAIALAAIPAALDKSVPGVGASPAATDNGGSSRVLPVSAGRSHS